MVDIRRLDPNKINARGYYADLSSTSMFLLTDEEIREARRFFRRPDLAKDRKISKQTYQSYKCQRTSPKSPSRIRIPKKLVPVALIGGTVIAISVGFVGNLKSSHEYLDPTMNVQAALKSEIVTVDPEEPITVVLEPTSSLDEVSELVTNPTTPSIPTSSVLEEKEEESIEAKRERWVHHFCDIYQVDFDIVYQKLVEVTNNFTNDDYLHGHIPGVTCKGVEVYEENEEALLLYFVRCVKQLPYRFQLTSSQISISNDYQPDMPYGESVSYFSELLGEDRCLVYAIIEAETSWESSLFVNQNNPAGLRKGDGWWSFKTKEEGFIELILELKKYARMGATSIPKIATIHAPRSEGNEDWIPNVSAMYEIVSNHPEEYFGTSNTDEKVPTR